MKLKWKGKIIEEDEFLCEGFQAYELMCQCRCGKLNVQSELLKFLMKVRKYLDRTIIINSCCRCFPHHVDIYKKKYGIEWLSKLCDRSKHLDGLAVDIRSDCFSTKEFNKIKAWPEIQYAYCGSGFCHFQVYRDGEK